MLSIESTLILVYLDIPSQVIKLITKKNICFLMMALDKELAVFCSLSVSLHSQNQFKPNFWTYDRQGLACVARYPDSTTYCIMVSGWCQKGGYI